MGFFSWKTADSKESIANVHSERHNPARPVYLLEPGGKPAKESGIVESHYEGYGVFGGVDAFVWLAEHNLPEDVLRGMSEEDRRDAGSSMDVGGVVRDRQTGKLYTVFHPVPFVENVTHLGVHWDAPLGEFDGLSANKLVGQGRFEILPVSEIFPVRFPLKFSFDPEAIYENLPASETDPSQGYFYVEDDEGSDPSPGL